MPETKSSKKTTSKKLSAYEKSQLRTPLEQELYGCAKKGQAVLLYGNDTVGRFDLLYMPHVILHEGFAADGIFEYLRKEEIPKTCDNPYYVYRDYLIPEMRKAIDDGNHKRIFKLICLSRYPSYMLKRVNCENESGKAVFEKLTESEEFPEDKLIDYINSIDSLGYIEGIDTFCSNFEKIFRLSSHTKEFIAKPSTLCFRYEGLLWNPGTLFIDNLRCVKDDLEDEKYYEKLASLIQEERQHIGRKQVEWLVAYAYDHTTFPKRFRDQFELVSLDREKTVVVPVAGVAVSEELQGESNNQLKADETIKLRLVENGSMVLWEGNPLTTIRGKDFDILHKLARDSMAIVTHHALYKLIDSDEHVDELLRQRINYIRNAFPSPFNDHKHPQAIIKTKRMEGYYLNLTEEQVEIA